MNELTAAALIGAFAAALQQFENGLLRIFRAAVTGFFLAFYIGEDAANFIQQFFNFEISHEGTIFLVAFFGTEVLEKMILLARSFNLDRKWSDK